MRKNTPKTYQENTHGGGPANPHLTVIQELRRTVLSCLLWEDQFYETGSKIAARISVLADQVSTEELAALAIEARSEYNLRHVPLLLLCHLVKRGGSIVSETIYKTIQRADEMPEFLKLYWLDGRKPLSKQMKKGLAKAYTKFDAYRLGKYNRDTEIKLRDVMRLVHPKPKDDVQAKTFEQIIDGTLKAPTNTWEFALSSGKDKKATFEELINDGDLGYLALLKNLRGMEAAGVSQKLIEDALLARKGANRVFPFRFLAAAKAAPRYEDAINQAMLATLQNGKKLPGKTVCIIDVSGSMYNSMVSSKSDMTRAHAACALGAIIREVAENPVIYATAGSDSKLVHATQLVPNRRGIALADAIYAMRDPLGGGGIFLKQVMDFVYKKENTADRVIVITDEQDCSESSEDHPSNAKLFAKNHYLINVSSYDRSINFGKWTQVNGFSEAVVTWIIENETLDIRESNKVSESV